MAKKTPLLTGLLALTSSATVSLHHTDAFADASPFVVPLPKAITQQLLATNMVLAPITAAQDALDTAQLKSRTILADNSTQNNSEPVVLSSAETEDVSDTTTEEEAPTTSNTTDKPSLVNAANNVDAVQKPRTVIAQAPTTPPVDPDIGKTTITEIDISGNQRIETSTIISFMDIEKGSRVNNQTIDKALASLFRTGLFADVSIKLQGSTLRVQLVENPIINEVSFEGNKRVEDDSLKTEVKLRPRSVYTKNDLQNDVKRILDIYQKSGRFSAVVVPKIIQLDKNRVNLVYEIDEGEKTQISKIFFVGNQYYTDSKLKKILQTKEARWYRFLSTDDIYDSDRVEFDKELLRRFYISQGFADFKVTTTNAELTPDKSSFHLTFSIDEGDRYTFGDMSVESRLTDVNTQALEALILSEPEHLFDYNKIQTTVEQMTEELGNQGYAFVKIDPQYDRDTENDIIGVKYVIKEGPRVYVENINIHGNVRTLDSVVRREFRLAEGDPYNTDKIKRSQQRVRNLNFFENVDIKTSEGSAPDKIDIDVEVEEKSTGELTIGAGFSTSEGALGDISISERNLLGRGQHLRLNFTLATSRQEIDLGFTEPYFMGREVAVGFDLFKVTREKDSARSSRSFDIDSIGGVLRSHYKVIEHLTHSVRYSLRSDEITDIDSDASFFIRAQEGKNTTSLVGHSLIYDKRDSKLEATEGYLVRFNQDVAGLGGDSRFVRHEVKGSYYYPVAEDWTLQAKGGAGYVFGYGGEDVRINDRFFIGGREIRGFESDGIGPRDSTSLDPLGGKYYATGSVELNFPLGLPEELGFTGAIFSDFGTLGGTDDETVTDPVTGTTSSVLDEASIRASVGAGIAWVSPVGPIRIDFAYPFAKEDFDETEIVSFNFGTRF